MKDGSKKNTARWPSCIRFPMVRWLLVVALLLSPWRAFATDGIFQGKVVDPPAQDQARAGWIFVEGHNHLLRRVDVSHAEIVLAPGVVPSRRGKCDWECITAGQEIKVTASQDSSGEWRAKRVEILRLGSTRGPSTTLGISPGGSHLG